MTLLDCITLAVSHHPAPYRQIKHYWRTQINFAYMRGDIKATFTEGEDGKLVGDYDRDSFMKWLNKQHGRMTPVYLDSDVSLALDGKGKDEVSELVNSAIRDSLMK